jgi:hypothetical protein
MSETVAQQKLRALGSVRKVARKFSVAPSTAHAWLRGRSRPEHAERVRLEKLGGPTLRDWDTKARPAAEPPRKRALLVYGTPEYQEAAKRAIESQPPGFFKNAGQVWLWLLIDPRCRACPAPCDPCPVELEEQARASARAKGDDGAAE